MAAPLDRFITPVGTDQTSPFWLQNLERQRARLEVVQKAVDGYDDLPTLPPRNIDHIQVEAMSDPVMKGTDDEGRMYVAFRLVPKAGGDAFVVTFCQFAKYADQWTQKTNVDRYVFNGTFDTDVGTIGLLMHGTHPEFRVQ